MLLRLVDASDSYIDYGSLNFPIRPLADAPKGRDAGAPRDTT
jgi:hypothetical protein